MVSTGLLSPPSTIALSSWANVIPHFQRLRLNIFPKLDDIVDAKQKALNVGNALYREYYSSETPIVNQHYLVVGSIGKGVARSPLNDVDMLFQLPDHLYYRYSRYSDNGQSAMLQDVKEVIQRTFRTSDIRGDGQVVIVEFNSRRVEVVPVFYMNGIIISPNTHHGGSWNTCSPHREAALIQEIDKVSIGKGSDLIRFAKAWKDHCNVPIKSVVLERAALCFASAWRYRDRSMFWYDWMVRDFFQYLIGCTNNGFQLPGSKDLINTGDSWLSKCLSAYDHAAKACSLEENAPYFPHLAEQEWQKIFGPF